MPAITVAVTLAVYVTQIVYISVCGRQKASAAKDAQIIELQATDTNVSMYLCVAFNALHLCAGESYN